MIMINNPFGQDPMDFNDETSASRVGDRIRTIRIAKGLSQAELGEMVGLNADRIQKYENGVRKPKPALLKQFATALGVSTLALTDPVTTNYISAMHAFFELENNFDMKIERSSDDKPPRMCLTVDFRNEMFRYMEEWYKIYSQTQTELESATDDDERNQIIKFYHDWEWNFPQGIVDQTTKALQKARLKNKIEELQEVYDKLDND